jgi:hypothetical protein
MAVRKGSKWCSAARLATVRTDVDCGKWDEMYHDLRAQPEFDGALRVVVGQPAR